MAEVKKDEGKNRKRGILKDWEGEAKIIGTTEMKKKIFNPLTCLYKAFCWRITAEINKYLKILGFEHAFWSSGRLQFFHLLLVHLLLVVQQLLWNLRTVEFDIGLQLESLKVRDVIEREFFLVKNKTFHYKVDYLFSWIDQKASNSAFQAI